MSKWGLKNCVHLATFPKTLFMDYQNIYTRGHVGELMKPLFFMIYVWKPSRTNQLLLNFGKFIPQKTSCFSMCGRAFSHCTYLKHYDWLSTVYSLYEIGQDIYPLWGTPANGDNISCIIVLLLELNEFVLVENLGNFGI